MGHYKQVVRVLKAVTIDDGEVMTLSEAAKVLGVGLSTMTRFVTRQNEPLTYLVDESEPNPTKANRVLRSEVLAEKRRMRAGGRS